MARNANSQLLSLWQIRLDAQHRSGLSVQAFCKQQRLKPHSFYFWKKRLASQAQLNIPTGLIPVRIVNNSSQPEPFARIQFSSGVTIEATADLIRIAIDQILASERTLRGSRS
jgi:hypothetical protein